MIDTKRLREVIKICDSLDPNDDFGIEKCWDEMIEILSCDVSETISYFNNDCTDEDFYLLSNLFEDIVEKTQCAELIKVFKNRLAKVEPETYSQENFESAFMRKHATYDDYVRTITMEIGYGEARLG